MILSLDLLWRKVWLSADGFAMPKTEGKMIEGKVADGAAAEHVRVFG